VSDPDAVLSWVALGDSYTIGTSVAPGDGWPDRLVAALDADPPPGPRLRLVANHALNGSSSAAVRRDQLPLLAREADLGFASLLVGANDAVQGIPEPRYRADVAAILDACLARLPADRILGVETPDYTVTPMGAAFGEPAERRAAIVRCNAAFADLCAARRIRFVDGILAISADAGRDLALVASDGLHPSAAQYRRWVAERIEPAVRALLAPA
jgi:lysophospholipase L1-like esterase